MPDEIILVGVLTVLSVAFLHIVKKTFPIDGFKTSLRLDSTRTIAILVVVAVNIPYFFDPGRAQSELLREGLSISNIINIFDSIVMAFAAVYLLAAARRLKFDLISGPSFWLVLLFALYFASTIWSFYPQGSAFRAFELIVYYVVAVFVFTGRQPLQILYWVMFLEILLGGATLLIGGLAGGNIIGFMQSNQHSLYAAVFLLLHYHLYRPSISGYLFGLFFLLGFGSTTTFAAFLGGVATYAVYGYASGPVYLLRVPITLTIIGLYLWFIFFPEVFSGFIDIVAAVLQKRAEKFSDASGRIALWQFYYEYLKSQPFGIGFWSERFIFARGYDVPWSAMNAHNGFLTAWIGAGVPALGCLSMVYVSIIAHLRRQDVAVRRIGVTLLFMLFVNSITYAGIGGFFSMWYYVLAAIIVLSNLGNSEAKRVVGISPAIGELGKAGLQGQT